MKSEKKPSKNQSASNEKEVRLVDIEGKSGRSKVSSSHNQRSGVDSEANTTVKPKTKSNNLHHISEVDEEDNTSKLKVADNKDTSSKRSSKKSLLVTKDSNESAMLSKNK